MNIYNCSKRRKTKSPRNFFSCYLGIVDSGSRKFFCCSKFPWSKCCRKFFFGGIHFFLLPTSNGFQCLVSISQKILDSGFTVWPQLIFFLVCLTLPCLSLKLESSEASFGLSFPPSLSLLLTHKHTLTLSLSFIFSLSLVLFLTHIHTLIYSLYFT